MTTLQAKRFGFKIEFRFCDKYFGITIEHVYTAVSMNVVIVNYTIQAQTARLE